MAPSRNPSDKENAAANSDGDVVPESSSVQANSTKQLAVRCAICGLRSFKKSQLEQHHKAKHLIDSSSSPVPVYQCSICSKVNKKYDVILKHTARNHVDCNSNFSLYEKPTTCKLCGKRFGTKTSLTEHVNSKHFHNDDESIPSPIEPKANNNNHSSSLRSLLDENSSVQDDNFGESFSPENYEESQISNIPDKELESSFKSANKTNSPAKLTSAFKKSSASTSNIDKNTSASSSVGNISIPGTSDAITATSIKDSSPKKLLCATNSKQECSKEQNVSRSEFPDAKQTKEGFWQCSICHKIINTYGGYYSHMMAHRGRRFDCDKCDASYSQKVC